MLWALRFSANKLVAQWGHHSSLVCNCAMEQQLNFKFCFGLRKSSYRHTQNAYSCLQMCSSISYTSSNGLKDEKKTTVMIRAVTEVCDLVATDHQMTIKWNINYTFSRCFMKILDAGSSTPSLFHTHTHTHTHTQSHILERGAQSCNW